MRGGACFATVQKLWRSSLAEAGLLHSAKDVSAVFTTKQLSLYRARICKPFMEPWNRLPARWNLFPGSLNVYNYGPSTCHEANIRSGGETVHVGFKYLSRNISVDTSLDDVTVSSFLSGCVCALTESELEFVDVKGAKESTPRNRFRQPM